MKRHTNEKIQCNNQTSKSARTVETGSKDGPTSIYISQKRSADDPTPIYISKKRNTANKPLTQEQIGQKRAERERLYREKCRGLHPFYFIILIVCVLLLCLFFTQFVFVDNTDAGREVSVSGWQFIAALLSGGFDNASLGDVAVPFYYYAQTYTVAASVLFLLTALFLIATIVCTIITIVKKAYVLTYISLITSVLSTLFLIAGYAVCLLMSGSDILPVYCQGNTACSIGSDAVYAVIFAIVMTGLSVYTAIRHTSAEKILTGKRKISNEK